MVQASRPNLGIVSSCNVLNCIHNLGQQCTAGGIGINFADDLAQCESYIVKTSDTVAASDGAGVGDVYRCDAVECIHNDNEHCMVNTIIVSFLNGKAKCDTYNTKSDK